jgi:hypothetical protein
LVKVFRTKRGAAGIGRLGGGGSVCTGASDYRRVYVGAVVIFWLISTPEERKHFNGGSGMLGAAIDMVALLVLGAGLWLGIQV